MSSAKLSGVARWPNVPACYGWLALDARGRWRIGQEGGELVHHSGLIAFLNQNYQSTAAGAWFIQNGPQRAFVTLERAPYIVRLVSDGTLATHTGLAVRNVMQALLDADGNAYLACEHGLVGIDDRDLSTLLATGAENPSEDSRLYLQLEGQRITLVEVDKDSLPERFGFIPNPKVPG